MAKEQNMEVVRRYVEEGFNAGSMETLDEVFASDFVYHDPGNPSIRDLEGLKESVRMLHRAFPDVHTSIDSLLNDGDCVIKRFTLRGTQHGEFNGIPPTGKGITLEGIDILRVADGKIQEIWMGVDYLVMLQQLGVVPQPEQVAV